jgi:hypothetical protein
VRLAVTAFLAVHVFISAWLVATVEGAYTEGRPAPTEVHSLVAIDKDRTMIDVEIKKATSFFLYTLVRDGDASVPVNESGEQDAPQANNGSETAPSESTEEEQERAWLDIGRQSVGVALVLLVLSEALMLTGVRWRHHVRTLAFLSTLVAFSVVFPACYMLELSGGEEDDETATNTPGAEIETVSFVHTNSSSDVSLVWLGLQLNAGFSGYDLGLVEEENRTTVAASIPEPGSKDASSYIAFESTFQIQLGQNLDSLLILPFLWYVLPAANLRAPVDEDLLSEDE